ncbi:hypothetical protein QJS66_20370 [Kocuria rhizophila]|nr:hypothetical protein QJS66_20370 [Kocuria rhizophila]
MLLSRCSAMRSARPRSAWVTSSAELPPWPDPVHGGRHGCQARAAYRAAVEMFGYIGDLRSKTQGRAVYSISSTATQRFPRPWPRRSYQKNRGE